jgi:transcriptional regulator with XRE-family HTH domain
VHMTAAQLDSSQPPVSFAALLRQHRERLGLTQAVLAERAGLSAHGIQKLEHGATQPYRDAADRLSRALQLPEQDAARFKAAAQPLRRRDKALLPAERSSPRHNLPVPTTTFVPRAGEIERVIQRLRVSRLLTITGAGGCGTTGLATEVASQVVGDFADCTWLVDLDPLADANLVPQTIAWDSTVYSDPIATQEHIFEVARTAPGDEEFARAVAAGQSFTLEEAIAGELQPETLR